MTVLNTLTFKKYNEGDSDVVINNYYIRGRVPRVRIGNDGIHITKSNRIIGVDLIDQT